jgi:hypothetical protein
MARQRVLKDGNRNRYAIYALGEVVLVFVGVLVALQVSNLNETRNQRQTEQFLLKSLQKEMMANQERLGEAMSYHSKSREAAKKIIEIYNGNHPGEDYQEIDSLLALIQWAWTYDPSMGALNSIKMSGHLNSVQNSDLRTMITNYEDLIKDTKEENKILQDLIIEKYIPAVNQYIPLSRRAKYLGEDYEIVQSAFPSDYEGLFRDRSIEGVISYIYIWRIDEFTEEKQLEKVMEDFIFILDKEIEE